MYTEVADTSAAISGKFKPGRLSTGGGQVSARRQLLCMPAQINEDEEKIRVMDWRTHPPLFSVGQKFIILHLEVINASVGS
jgi:hypothetical protein